MKVVLLAEILSFQEKRDFFKQMTQIKNTSLLSPNKFIITINKFPDIAFWAQSVTLPTVTITNNRLGTNKQYVMKTPGDTMEYDDLIIRFLVDEDLKGYKVIKQWQEEMTGSEIPEERFSDLTVSILTNNSNINHILKFKDSWPVLLGSLFLDVTQGEDAVSTDVTFSYSTFTIESNS